MLRKNLSGKNRPDCTEQYTKGGWAGIGGFGVKFIEGDGKTSIGAWIICGVRFINSCATKMPENLLLMCAYQISPAVTHLAGA
jgi:hypothetical protein